MDYKSAGVDVEAGYKAVELIKTYEKQEIQNEQTKGRYRWFWRSFLYCKG